MWKVQESAAVLRNTTAFLSMAEFGQRLWDSFDQYRVLPLMCLMNWNRDVKHWSTKSQKSHVAL